ncbi:protein AATF-like isoform X2 [Gordionus sp. m RMFG-2023]
MNLINDHISSELEKSNGIKLNSELWNKLVKTRILLNNVLIYSNYYKNETAEVSALRHKANIQIKSSLKKLIKIQSLLFPFKFDFKGSSDSNKKDLCEKIQIVFKGFNDSFKPYRDNIIADWDEKFKHSNSSIDQGHMNSRLEQIYKILDDTDGNLLQRTKVRRVIPNLDEQTCQKSIMNVTPLTTLDTNEDIFDDHDFYYELIKDFVNNTKPQCVLNNGLDTSIQNIKNIQLNKKSMGLNSNKKILDTKCTKKRRLRYDPIPKLINYMCPQEDINFDDNI